MQFLIIGLDGTDDKAMDRRLAVRDQHIALGDELLKSGNMWYGAALWDDNGNMKGSALMMDFESEAKLQEWLDKEPYVVGDVWRELTIHKCNTRDPWQFNQSKEWFESQQGIQSKAAVDIAQEYFTFSNDRNLNDISELLTPTTTYSSENVGVLLGKEKIMEMKHSFYGSFKEIHWDIESVSEEKPGVVRFEFTFTGTTTDDEKVIRPGIEYVIVVNGQIQHVEVRNI